MYPIQLAESFNDHFHATAGSAPAPAPEPDFIVNNHGSVCVLRAVSPAAKEWVEESLHIEGWQLWGRDGIAVDPRMLAPILDGIEADGYIVEA